LQPPDQGLLGTPCRSLRSRGRGFPHRHLCWRVCRGLEPLRPEELHSPPAPRARRGEGGARSRGRSTPRMRCLAPGSSSGRNPGPAAPAPAPALAAVAAFRPLRDPLQAPCRWGCLEFLLGLRHLGNSSPIRQAAAATAGDSSHSSRSRGRARSGQATLSLAPPILGLLQPRRHDSEATVSPDSCRRGATGGFDFGARESRTDPNLSCSDLI